MLVTQPSTLPFRPCVITVTPAAWTAMEQKHERAIAKNVFIRPGRIPNQSLNTSVFDPCLDYLPAVRTVDIVRLLQTQSDWLNPEFRSSRAGAADRPPLEYARGQAHSDGLDIQLR